MSLAPNRISAFGPFSPQREMELARQLVDVRSETELDRFLPLLAAAAPMIANIAGPLLKNLAGGLFGGGGKKRRPRDEQEQFLGRIVKGMFGETEYENENEFGQGEQEQFIGGILKGIMGGELESYEQEQFIGGLVGKLFGGELETENYVQEQFLGGILKGIMGGELETENEAGGRPRLLRRARKFVRFVNAAACHAAAELANMQRAGHRPSPPETQHLVLSALVNAARKFFPRMTAAAFPGGVPGPQPPAPQMSAPPPGQAGQTMLEMMIAGATPLGAPARASRSNGYPLG